MPLPPPPPMVDPIEEPLPPPPMVDPREFLGPQVGQNRGPSVLTGGDLINQPQLTIEDRISRLEKQFGGINDQFSNINNLISGPFSGGYGNFPYMNNSFGYESSPYLNNPFGYSSRSVFSPMLYGGVGGFMPYFG